ncbi:hypothetical protein HDU96_004991 [Phlyctochytrium bullatum]|nr:hypothetical protein HDU96_004991 [Phlyctochytrium bullatum]
MTSNNPLPTSPASSSSSSDSPTTTNPSTLSPPTTTTPPHSDDISKRDLEAISISRAPSPDDIKKDSASFLVSDAKDGDTEYPRVNDDGEPATPVSEFEGPPDGGWQAWMVVFGSFMVHFVVLGVQYSFGVYATYFIKQGKGSPATVSFVGTLGAAVLPALGMVSGRLAEKFGFQRMIYIGTSIFALGLLLASFCTEIWQLFITQGFMTGLGASISYFPAVSAPSQWFLRNRGVATGIAVSGSGIGGLVLTLATQKMLDALGFAWTLRVTAIFSFVAVVSVTPFIRNRIPPSPQSKTDWSVLKDKRFALLLGMGFFATFALLVPLYFIPTYTVEVLNQPVGLGATLLSVYNGSSAAGRIVLGFGADSFLGRLNSLVLCMVVSGLSMLFLWTFASSVPILALFAIVNGFVAGGFISLFPVVVASIFGAERLPSMVGMLFSTSAIGNFGGAPLAGAIKERAGFTAAIVYAGVTTCVSSGFIVVVRFIQERSVFKRV